MYKSGITIIIKRDMCGYRTVIKPLQQCNKFLIVWPDTLAEILYSKNSHLMQGPSFHI